MGKTVLALSLVVFLTWTAAQAKFYTRCGLAIELYYKGFHRHELQNWVCLIENESGRDTSKVVYKENGSMGLGLFQIKSDWCRFGKPGGECNMRCEDLIDENIIDDSICARKVETELGLNAWEGWNRSCRGQTPFSRIARTCLRSIPVWTS